jgi:Asp-tRNA(Asn)/Glu-tRNA(Gln) amidotransferase A subunit family amidase
MYLGRLREYDPGLKFVVTLTEERALAHGEQLVITNLAGHPIVILPNGLRGSDAPKLPTDDVTDFRNAGGPGTLASLTFIGKLYGEAELLAFARAYQEATGFHLLHPKLPSAS